MFTSTGDLYVIDFESAAFLPLSFMSYAVIQYQHLMSGVLEERLNLPSENIEAMRRVCSLFVMSTRKLGTLRKCTHTILEI